MNELLTTHYKEIVAIAEYICGSENARDLAHDAIVKVLENGKYEEQGKFLSYMYKIMRNLYFKQVTKASYNREVSVDPTDCYEYERSHCDEEFHNQLNIRLMAKDESEQKTKVLELYLDGHHIEDIASMLDITQSQVKYALSRIREAIKDKIS